MSNRHAARGIVLQTLFERDFNGEDNPAELHNLLRANAEKFAPGTGDFSFMEGLLDGVLEREQDLDTIIKKAAPDWPIEKIAGVDRNVLRLGLYELLFGDRKDVPAKVAINEAIELAKTYGGDSSGRFVNGVLGSVYKELGEPGKDEQSKRERMEVPYEKMVIEKLAGAVVFSIKGNEPYLALVHDVFGHWTLSKGSIEEGRSAQDAVARAVKEELGLDVAVKEKLGENEYVASHPEKGKHRKQVAYFLAETAFQELTLGTTGGLDDAKWFKLSEIVNLNMYDDIVPIVTKAINILLARDSK